MRSPEIGGSGERWRVEGLLRSVKELGIPTPTPQAAGSQEAGFLGWSLHFIGQTDTILPFPQRQSLRTWGPSQGHQLARSLNVPVVQFFRCHRDPIWRQKQTWSDLDDRDQDCSVENREETIKFERAVKTRFHSLKQATGCSLE